MKGHAVCAQATARPLNLRHVWPWTTLAPVLGVLAVFVLTVLDPLGFESVTKSQSANIFYKIYAAAYPVKMRDNISVVLLDNNTVERTFNDSWPPSHVVHRAVLDAILYYKPKAVLIDMLFFHKASKVEFDQIQDLVNSSQGKINVVTDIIQSVTNNHEDVINLLNRAKEELSDIKGLAEKDQQDFNNIKDIAKEYKGNGVPLFLTVGGPGIGAHSVGHADLEDKELKQNLTFVSAELAGAQEQPSLYPLPGDTHEPGPGGDTHEPAALALYHEICHDHLFDDVACPKAAASGPLQIPWLSESVIRSLNEYVVAPVKTSMSWLNENIVKRVGNALMLGPQEKSREDRNVGSEMEVVWGLSPSWFNCKRAEDNADVSNLTCRDLGLTWPSRALELGWEGVYPSQHRSTDPMLIPYHAEISTTDLLKGDHHKDLAQALTGKVVIYGGQVAPRKDLVLSPVHGKIDGAFIHAMALDNLLTWGKDSVIRRAPEGWFHKDWTEFEPLILMAVLAVLIAWRRRVIIGGNSPARSVKELRHRDERLLKFFNPVYSYPTIILLGLWQFFFWRIAPFNWIGMLIVIHIVHRIDKLFFSTVEREATDAGWSPHEETLENSSKQRAA